MPNVLTTMHQSWSLVYKTSVNYQPVWEFSLLTKTVQAVVHPMGKVMVTTIPQHTLKTIKLCFEGLPCDWSMQDNNNFHGKIDAADQLTKIMPGPWEKFKNFDLWEILMKFDT